MAALVLLCVGRVKNGAERDLSERYVKRATSVCRGLGVSLSVREIAESSARRPDARKTEEARALRAALPAGSGVLAFDERGRAAATQDLAELLRRTLDEGRSLALVIGGPDGLDCAFREAADHVVAFGAMTWPHQLVRIMAAEQLYRVVTILAGHPYHRA